MSGSHPEHIRPVLPILALALACRIGFFLLLHPWSYSVAGQLHSVDSPHYHLIARTLLLQHRFAPGPNAPPSSLRTPGYPVFAAGIYAIAGMNPWAVLLAQNLLDVLSCLLVFLALRGVSGVATARWGALFYALDPNLILHASLFLSETLFVFTMALALLLFVRARSSADSGRALPYLLLGLELGVATLVRPIGLYFAIACGLFLLAAYANRPRFALRSCVLLIAGAALLVVPWMARNLHAFGRPELTFIDSFDLLGGDVAAMEAPRRHLPVTTTEQQLMAEADSLMVEEGRDPWTMTPFQMAPYVRRLAFRYIRRDPAGFAIANLKGVVFGVVSPGSSAFAEALHLPAHSAGPLTRHGSLRSFGEKSLVELRIILVVVAFLLVAYLCGAVGAVVGWRRLDRRFFVFCLLAALYFLLVPGAYGNARLRVPTMPFLAGFMGLGLEQLVSILTRRRRGGAPGGTPPRP